MGQARAEAVSASKQSSRAWRDYYVLTKPGIVYGNGLAAVAGFLFVSGRSIHFGAFLAMLAGTSLVIASACVFNNILDLKIDSVMSRTKKRPLVQGSISRPAALIYASVLGLIGLSLLLIFNNLLTAATALAGIVLYVAVYGLAKRKTVYSTLVGSLSGSTPPVIGYVAVSGHLDSAAWLLFILMAAWQMPHFYAIAMFRRDDYAAAKLPIWSVEKGMKSTRRQIILFVVLFIAAALALGVSKDAKWSTSILIAALGIYWLLAGLRNYSAKDDIKWGRQMFGLSLLTLLAFCVLLSINAWLP